MKDFDIDNTIENANCDRKEQLRVQLHERLDLPRREDPQAKSSPRSFKFKIAFGIVSLCVVCVAIVLPILLRNNAPSLPAQNKYTYTAADFAKDNLGLTVKEYSEFTGKNILFLDWYEFADECITTKYFLPNDANNIIYISEDIINGETGDHVRISVVADNYYIDDFEVIREFCVNSYEYKNTNINWIFEFSTSRAYFEYNGYKYYLQLTEPMSEQAILDIVKEMF